MTDTPDINPAVIQIADTAVREIKPGSPLSTIVLGIVAVTSVIAIAVTVVTGHGEPAALIGVASLATGVLIPSPGGAK